MPQLDDLPHIYFDNPARIDGKCYWCARPEDDVLHTTDPLTAVVVVAFTDWKEAVGFARNPELFLLPPSLTVVGLYKVPTQFCSCASGEGTGERNKVMGYTRGKRFGWWVHHTCGKPAVAWARGFGVRLAHTFGNNLLKNAPYPFNDPRIAMIRDKEVGRNRRVLKPRKD